MRNSLLDLCSLIEHKIGIALVALRLLRKVAFRGLSKEPCNAPNKPYNLPKEPSYTCRTASAVALRLHHKIAFRGLLKEDSTKEP